MDKMQTVNDFTSRRKSEPSGNIETVGQFQEFSSLYQARKAVQKEITKRGMSK
jgi:hypothetical protein